MKKNELQPWQQKAWGSPPAPDAACVCPMEEILDLDEQPDDPPGPQVWVDDMSTQLRGEVRDPLPAQPGNSCTYDTAYQRHGTANIVLACAPLSGQRDTPVTDHRTKVDFAHDMHARVEEGYPDAEKICLVMDNLKTQHTAALDEAFVPPEAKSIADTLESHDTPTHGSWLTMAEIELSHLRRQCLADRIEDKTRLIHEVQAWNKKRHDRQAKAHWQFTTADARVKLIRLYPTLSM